MVAKLKVAQSFETFCTGNFGLSAYGFDDWRVLRLAPKWSGCGVVSGFRFGWVSIWSLAVSSFGGLAPEGSLRLRHGIGDWVAAHTTLR